jgi:hypothetical protein
MRSNSRIFIHERVYVIIYHGRGRVLRREGDIRAAIIAGSEHYGDYRKQ